MSQKIRILIQRIFDDSTIDHNVEEIVDVSLLSPKLAASLLREAANELDPKPMVPAHRRGTGYDND